VLRIRGEYTHTQTQTDMQTERKRKKDRECLAEQSRAMIKKPTAYVEVNDISTLTSYRSMHRLITP